MIFSTGRILRRQQKVVSIQLVDQNRVFEDSRKNPETEGESNYPTARLYTSITDYIIVLPDSGGDQRPGKLNVANNNDISGGLLDNTAFMVVVNVLDHEGETIDCSRYNYGSPPPGQL